MVVSTKSAPVLCTPNERQNDSEKSPQNDVDKQDTFANSSLHEACKKGDMDRVRHILTHGLMGINSKDEKGRTAALMMAAQQGHCKIFKLRNVSHVYLHGSKALFHACMDGHITVVKYLLSLGSVDINSIGRYGMTPLMVAALNGHTHLFDVLVRKGANASYVDNKGYNILHLASAPGDMKMVKHILSKNLVDINAREKSGKTAAMIAKFHKRNNVYKFLVSQGCQVK
ncbi:ankyrin repeat domain-containing protein 50-like [Haliotis asinina]|uniref:ankyrin repeat domain-containing protein 50-like n=1 Tax=Haliotis asinina TaxID=109174 RepID=UPI003531D0C9